MSDEIKTGLFLSTILFFVAIYIFEIAADPIIKQPTILFTLCIFCFVMGSYCGMEYVAEKRRCDLK